MGKDQEILASNRAGAWRRNGPVRFRVAPREEASTRPFRQLVIPRITEFGLPAGAEAWSIQDIYGALATTEARNDLICADVLNALEQGRTPLVLTERTQHLEELRRRLEATVSHLVVLRGGLGARKRRAAIEELAAVPPGEPAVVLATGRYAGEGFDHPRLDTLFLALPVSWRGTLRQYAGRLNRLHQDKLEVRIYDYVDGDVPMLGAMYRKRLKGYRAMGYVVQDRVGPPGAEKGLPSLLTKGQLSTLNRTSLEAPEHATTSSSQPEPSASVAWEPRPVRARRRSAPSPLGAARLSPQSSLPQPDRD